jgi:predicted RNA binding protein YcfA (HicA-like mRNA interferase family)
MKLARDISGTDLARALSPLGYKLSRQTGSHMRLTTQERGEHHVTIPMHDPLRIGTLSGILADVGEHFGLSRSEVIERLFRTGRSH